MVRGDARSWPPRDQPRYHVLVHDAAHTTYIAERNLDAEVGDRPIRHSLLGTLFTDFEGGVYKIRRRAN